MKKNCENPPNVKPVFLLGKNPSFIREDELGFETVNNEDKLDLKINRILEKINLDMEQPLFVKKEEDLHNLDISYDVFLIFSLSIERYPGLILLASTQKPVIITSEEGNINCILDTYEYLSEFENVTFSCTYKEVKEIINNIDRKEPLIKRKICLFDSGNRSLEQIVWYKNQLLKDIFNLEMINIKEFKNIYKSVSQIEVKSLTGKWMEEADLREPSPKEIGKSVRLYLAMKKIIESMKADVAYVLWCGQFSSMLGTKMCFAVSKLNDDGILTGCWRGGNLLSMIILEDVSRKKVFFGEAHMYRNGILSLRHCAVPCGVGDCRYILRRWREQRDTVTGYCELPEGEVTIVNIGQADSALVIEGDVVRSDDIGGQNCRNTIWIELKNRDIINKLTGVEFAMVYGNYKEQVINYLKGIGFEYM